MNRIGEKTVKKNILISVIVLVGLILGACTDKALEVTDVVDKIEEHSDDVESYHSLTEFNVEMDLEADSLSESSYMNMDVEIDEAANTIHAQILEENNGQKSTQELYRGDDGIGYQTENDSEWFKFEVGEGVSVSDGFTSSYDKIVAIISDVADVLEMEADDDHYILTFEGANTDVLKALEEPFNVEVSGVQDDDIIHDLMIIVTKEDYHITQLTDEIVGEVEHDIRSMTIEIDQNYSDINDLDDIVVPDEVVNNAT